ISIKEINNDIFLIVYPSRVLKPWHSKEVFVNVRNVYLRGRVMKYANRYVVRISSKDKDEATEKKRKSLLTFNKAAITKEEQDYKFEYEKLEKEYLELIESISKDIKSRYNL
ncbi:MAG: hypothetical protein QW396_03460, partial [Metallosphaera sp.]